MMVWMTMFVVTAVSDSGAVPDLGPTIEDTNNLFSKLLSLTSD